MSYCCEIFKDTYFEKHLRSGCFWTHFRKWFFGTLLLDSHFQNHPDLVILPSYQSLSNQSFKHNSAHTSSLYVTPMNPELRLLMFIINGYCITSKRLQSLDSLFYYNFTKHLLLLGDRLSICKHDFRYASNSLYAEKTTSVLRSLSK